MPKKPTEVPLETRLKQARRRYGPLPKGDGEYVCYWIEANLVHGEGDWYGQPIRLQPEQIHFICKCYERTKDGRRKFRRVLRGKPKGYAKTELAAMIACVELGGDLVVGTPSIPVAAASYDQADLVFGAAKIMLGEGPISHLFEIYETEILRADGPGRMFRVAAVAGTNDGLKPTFFVCDEVHEWLGNKERVHLVISNGLAKRRDSWELNISTAGSDPGIETGEPETLLGKLYTYGKKVQSGEIKDPSFLFDWTEAEGEFDLSTRQGWKAAVKSCDPPSFVDIESVVTRCMEIPEFEGRRYYLNNWTHADESWLPVGAWDRLEVPEFKFNSEAPLYVGVDAATKHDSTAIVTAQWSGDKLRTRARIWERPIGLDGKPKEGWKLPITEVENELRRLHKDFNVSAVAYDPALFERSAQQLETERLPMVEIPQSDSRMVPACQAVYELVLQERLEHEKDPVFTRHVASAAAVEARNGGWRLKKIKAKAKMDAAIALCLAVDQAVHADTRGSIYEERGLVSL